jgi:glycosyltransferase involved in cell wall biosynthesis
MTAQVIRGDRALLHFDAIPTMTITRDRRVTLVIPAKNEARNIGWVLERVPLSVDEIVLVDGRSTDETIAVARAIRPDVVVVSDERPGKGAALRAGFEAATGDYIVMIDADGSMDPGEIDMFVDYLDRGADLVKGSRFMDGGGTADMSPLRAMGNRALLAIANGLVGSAHTDLCYGMAAFKRDRVLALELDAVGFEIETQLFLRSIRNGLLVIEAPSFEAPRRFGSSNLNTFRDGWRVLKTIFTERLRPVSVGRTVGLMENSPIEPLAE